MGTFPEEDQQLDFTQVLPSGMQISFSLVDTFAGWAETLPTHAEKTTETLMKLYLVLEYQEP
jgi:hypothetical protein